MNATKTSNSGNSVGNKMKSMGNTVYHHAQSNKGLVIGLIVLIFIVIIVMSIYSDSSSEYASKNPVLVDQPTNAFTNKIKSKKPPKNANPYASTYSLWVYVSDWNYKFGSWKNIFVRQSNFSKTGNIDLEPGMFFYPKTNSIHARISTTVDPNEGCDIKNIPLQKWVHIAYVLNNRNVDMYVDGKLERSCVLKGLPIIRDDSRIYIAKDGGFYGQISRFQFFGSALRPNDVMNLYTSGPYDGKKYNVNFFKSGQLVKIRDKMEKEGNSLENDF